jgi:hypothetical protein
MEMPILQNVILLDALHSRRMRIVSVLQDTQIASSGSATFGPSSICVPRHRMLEGTSSLGGVWRMSFESAKVCHLLHSSPRCVGELNWQETQKAILNSNRAGLAGSVYKILHMSWLITL